MSDIKKGCDVIVTYCWNRVGYNILRSLSARGLKVWVADTSKYNICSLSKYCAGSFIYPDPFRHENSFIRSLIAKVKELHPKVLIPTHDEGIIIARYRNRFPNDLIIIVEAEEKLRRLSNKRIATELASKVGVPVPRVFQNITEIKNFPIVFKTVVGNSAKGVFFPKNECELKGLVKQYSGSETLMQEWIGGSDVSVDCVRYGDFFQASVYKAVVTKTEGGGTTTQREIISMPILVDYANKLLKDVDYNGVCGLDFRLDPDNNRIAFIEINTRFTGGIATPIAAGFDIPFILYSLATTGKYEGQTIAKIGVRTKWILGDIITLVGRIISFKFDRDEMRKAMSFSGFDAFDDYWSDDRMAIIGEMMYYFTKLVKNGKLNP